MECDLIIKNGLIVDGGGGPGFAGHAAVKDGRILDVFQAEDPGVRDLTPARTLDASGLAVSPGFIDVHSHIDFNLYQDEHPAGLTCLPEQGVTSVVAGNCGFSPAPLAPDPPRPDLIEETFDFLGEGPPAKTFPTMESWLSFLEETGVSLNLAQLTGHGLMRLSLWGDEYGVPAETEFRRIESMIEESLAAGSFGLSFGLGYSPGLFVSERELERLAALTRRFDRILTVHNKALSRISPGYPLALRGEPHNLRSLRETLDLAEKTGVRLQISHLIFVGKKTWPTADQALHLIEAAAERGLDVGFDSFPQTAGNTTILAAFPEWFLRDPDGNFRSRTARARLKLEWRLMSFLVGFGVDDVQVMAGGLPEAEKFEGLFMAEAAREMNCSKYEACLELARLSRGRTLCLFHKYSGDDRHDQPLGAVLTHKLNLFMTDALIRSKGQPNPGACGTFPRILGGLVREERRLTLEEAIHKMTGASAQRFGLENRGRVLPGYWADLTVFDPARISDETKPGKMSARPSGLKWVLINGQAAVENGRAVPGLRAGRVLRKTS